MCEYPLPTSMIKETISAKEKDNFFSVFIKFSSSIYLTVIKCQYFYYNFLRKSNTTNKYSYYKIYIIAFDALTHIYL